MADMTTTIITEENVGDVAKTIRDAIAQKGSASKLTNSRKLWGRSFDGSSDIDDGIDIKSYINLRDSARTGVTELLMDTDGLHVQAVSLSTGQGKKIIINENGGNVQVGNTSERAKLAIGGTLHSDGNITGGADITASGNVVGMSGVSAKGIADFSISGGGSATGPQGPAGTNGTTPTIKVASGSNIGSVGTPSVTASTSGTTTTFTFNYLKGAKGDKGDKGDTGPAGVSKSLSLICGSTSTVYNGANDVALTIAATNGITATPTLSGTALSVTIAANNASTSAKGVVQLSDATDSTSTSLAATANAVKKTYNHAQSAYSIATSLASNLSSFITVHEFTSTGKIEYTVTHNLNSTNILVLGVYSAEEFTTGKAIYMWGGASYNPSSVSMVEMQFNIRDANTLLLSFRPNTTYVPISGHIIRVLILKFP